MRVAQVEDKPPEVEGFKDVRTSFISSVRAPNQFVGQYQPRVSEVKRK